MCEKTFKTKTSPLSIHITKFDFKKKKKKKKKKKTENTKLDLLRLRPAHYPSIPLNLIS